MPTAAPPPPAYELPARFRVARRTLMFDRFMTGFIKIGGVLVITAVAGIFLFILVQILPLFRGAEVKELKTIAVPLGAEQSAQPVALGVDEWSELPVIVDAAGGLTFIDTVHGRPPERVVPEFSEQREIT